MKLACVRCKKKKIKCDKGEPVCHQCITANTECQYVERRQRPRLAQQRVAVHHLSTRLEQLEKQLSTATAGATYPNTTFSTPLSLPHTESEALSDCSLDSPVPSPKVSMTQEDGQDSWIYRMASDVRRNFQNQSTPVTTPTPRIDHAMSSLNEALDDLGRLRIRDDARDVTLNLSITEKKECIESFIRMMSGIVVPDIITIPFDIKLLRSLPDIINSPYINIDPGMHVIYYNALWYGLNDVRGQGDPVAHSIYLKVLEAVPAWLEDPTESDLDGHTAEITAWTAITNHDYQLSWKFHCKSCQHIRSKKIDHIDVFPARSQEEEAQRDHLRYLYWQILSTDILFVLLYGKPTVMRWSPTRVKPPNIMSPGNMAPSMIQITVAVFWIRYTSMTAEMINRIDEYASKDRSDIERQVDRFCHDLEALMLDFDVESIMTSDKHPDFTRYLVADHIMNVYAIIIGIKRRVRRPGGAQGVDDVTLRAARQVVDITMHFNAETSPKDSVRSVCIYFISFYPFCAVFALYEHVMACTNPEDCEKDIAILNLVGEAMEETSRIRTELLPFARTINALNKVSQTMQEERKRQGRPMSASEEGHNMMNDIDPAAFPSFSEFPVSFDDNFQPLGFVRALENDVITRNWNESWWNINSIDEHMTMGGIPENMHPHVSDYGSLPTPNTT